MNSVKVSIITVVYNGAGTLEQTIKSVLAQNYSNLEYIIIDGGSTDGTQNIIKKYEKKLAYWVSEPDHGVYDAMNKGIQKATGDILGFINSGDRYKEEAFLQVVRQFKIWDPDILCCEVYRTDKGQVVGKRELPSNDLDKIRFSMLYCHQGMLAKREMLQGSMMFDTQYKISADYDWVLKCYYGGAKFAFFHQAIAYYDISGISTRQRKRLVEEAEVIAVKRLKASMLESKEKDVQEIREWYRKVKVNYALKYYLENNININQNCLEYKYQYSIFGSGAYGQECYKVLKKMQINICAIWDNDSSKWGNKIDEIEIQCPENIEKTNSIILIASLKYEREIEKQLKTQFDLKPGQYILYSLLREKIGMELVEGNKWL